MNDVISSDVLPVAVPVAAAVRICAKTERSQSHLTHVTCGVGVRVEAALGDPHGLAGRNRAWHVRPVRAVRRSPNSAVENPDVSRNRIAAEFREIGIPFWLLCGSMRK